MSKSGLKILKILLMDLLMECAEDEADSCTLTLSGETFVIITDIIFQVKEKCENDEVK